MGLMKVESGKQIPDEINVIIEIPMHACGVKYEVDKHTGVLSVDRFMATVMHYPANYGYVPHTLSEDGDPVDVLVVTPMPLVSGTVIAARPVGMLNMTDESGVDAKIIAVPVRKISKLYDHVQSIDDLPKQLLVSITHFFEHYKDLEEGKWVKITGWSNVEKAHQEIMSSVERAK